MSLASALSLSRVVATIPIAALIMQGSRNALLIAVVLFALAALTDLLDGPAARHGKTVGPFGIYLDTTGDKVLVGIVLIAMAAKGFVIPWMAMVIVGREFLIQGVRTLSAVSGFVLSANLAGKIKTTVTLVAMVVLLLAAAGARGAPFGLSAHAAQLADIGKWSMFVSVILTLWSGIKYVADARPLFAGNGADGENSTASGGMQPSKSAGS